MFSKEEALTALRVLDYEVHNGGFVQYWDNILRVELVGYLDQLFNLVKRGNGAGIPGYDTLEEVLHDLMEFGSPDDYFDEETYWENCPNCRGSGLIEDYIDPKEDDVLWDEVKDECPTCEGRGQIFEISTIDGWEVYEDKTKYLVDIYTQNAPIIRKGHEKVIELVDIHNIS